MQYCTDQMPPGFWKENRYEIISTIAYLVGVPVRIFENEHEPPRMDIFRKLELDKNARIVRNLCCLRTAIERNYKKISTAIQFDFKTLNSLPEYIPQECIRQLSDDGITFIKKSSTKLFQHVIEINKLLSDRVNNCRSLFPDWLNWQYVRDLFVMPNGLSEEGSKAAVEVYYGSLSLYPYQMYINWKPVDEGNILFSDKKFVKILYKQHGEIFEDDSLVSDASGYVKNAIYDYIDESIKSLVVVDCENSDPYKLCAALNSLDSDEISKISKIILFNDVHTVAAWQILESYTDIPVGPVRTTSIEFTSDADHTQDHKLIAAQQVQAWKKEGRTLDECKEYMIENGINSFHAANAIITKASEPATRTTGLWAFTVGDISFCVIPFEMFDTNGMFIKENSPFTATFLLTCANTHNTYLPSALGFQNGGYEVDQSKFGPGNGEKVADEYVAMLKLLKGE